MNVNDLINKGVESKRQGKLLEALDYYSQALKLQPYNSVIYTSMGKVYFLLTKRQEACFMYRLGVQFAILEHKDKLLSHYNIKTEAGRLELLEEFFNSTYHAAHAFIDLDEEQISYVINNVKKQNPHLNHSQVMELMEYVIKAYTSSISGGLIPEPSMPRIPKWNTNFDNMYGYLGRLLLEDNIDWNIFK